MRTSRTTSRALGLVLLALILSILTALLPVATTSVAQAQVAIPQQTTDLWLPTPVEGGDFDCGSPFG